MPYSIEIARTARKQMLSLPRLAQREVIPLIDGLADEPRPSGCRKLRNTELWRIRAGRYRVLYAIDETTRIITVLKVAIRREDTYLGL